MNVPFLANGNIAIGRLAQMECLEDALEPMNVREKQEFDNMPITWALAAWRNGRLVKWIKYVR